jgi:hypothetical protein
LLVQSQETFLRISVLEVYNDRLRDLLCPNRDERALKIREDPANGPYAVGIEKVYIDVQTVYTVYICGIST